MTCRVIVLHSAFGLTDGVQEFAGLLRAEGCTVQVPDFYDGLTFETVTQGVAHRDEVGYRELYARVADLPVDGAALVGFSLGASFAQRLCRPGVRLVSLVAALDPLPPDKLWCGVDVQLHQLAEDPWVDDEDVPAFRAAVAAAGAMFDHFVTPGAGHLFTEPSQPEYDRDLTELTVDRIVAAL
ncbi:dienelactone hydrolase family protein [Granulicoccus sp. GXG6511]|uniref:dienelactone hydrolase family protein n=1 Tax=Granulicoccus sp. GXG6511 TaxID=3381351 RepID=UPI003D7DF069